MLICVLLSIFVSVKNMGDYLEMENDIFFTPPSVGDSAQEIFVRLVRGYVHSNKAIYTATVGSGTKA